MCIVLLGTVLLAVIEHDDALDVMTVRHNDMTSSVSLVIAMSFTDLCTYGDFDRSLVCVCV